MKKKYKEKKKNYYKNLLKGTKEELTEHILTYKFKNNFNLLIILYITSISFFIFIAIVCRFISDFKLKSKKQLSYILKY